MTVMSPIVGDGLSHIKSVMTTASAYPSPQSNTSTPLPSLAQSRASDFNSSAEEATPSRSTRVIEVASDRTPPTSQDAKSGSTGSRLAAVAALRRAASARSPNAPLSQSEHESLSPVQRLGTPQSTARGTGFADNVRAMTRSRSLRSTPSPQLFSDKSPNSFSQETPSKVKSRPTPLDLSRATSDDQSNPSSASSSGTAEDHRLPAQPICRPPTLEALQHRLLQQQSRQEARFVASFDTLQITTTAQRKAAQPETIETVTCLRVPEPRTAQLHYHGPAEVQTRQGQNARTPRSPSPVWGPVGPTEDGNGSALERARQAARKAAEGRLAVSPGTSPLISSQSTSPLAQIEHLAGQSWPNLKAFGQPEAGLGLSGLDDEKFQAINTPTLRLVPDSAQGSASESLVLSPDLSSVYSNDSWSKQGTHDFSRSGINQSTPHGLTPHLSHTPSHLPTPATSPFQFAKMLSTQHPHWSVNRDSDCSDAGHSSEFQERSPAGEGLDAHWTSHNRSSNSPSFLSQESLNLSTVPSSEIESSISKEMASLNTISENDYFSTNFVHWPTDMVSSHHHGPLVVAESAGPLVASGMQRPAAATLRMPPKRSASIGRRDAARRSQVATLEFSAPVPRHHNPAQDAGLHNLRLHPQDLQSDIRQRQRPASPIWPPSPIWQPTQDEQQRTAPMRSNSSNAYTSTTSPDQMSSDHHYRQAEVTQKSSSDINTSMVTPAMSLKEWEHQFSSPQGVLATSESVATEPAGRERTIPALQPRDLQRTLAQADSLSRSNDAGSMFAFGDRESKTDLARDREDCALSRSRTVNSPSTGHSKSIGHRIMRSMSGKEHKPTLAASSPSAFASLKRQVSLASSSLAGRSRSKNNQRDWCDDSGAVDHAVRPAEIEADEPTSPNRRKWWHMGSLKRKDLSQSDCSILSDSSKPTELSTDYLKDESVPQTRMRRLLLASPVAQKVQQGRAHCHLYLFNDMLVLTHTVQPQRYRILEMTPLRSLEVMNQQDQDCGSVHLGKSDAIPRKLFRLDAPTLKEWLNRINLSTLSLIGSLRLFCAAFPLVGDCRDTAFVSLLSLLAVHWYTSQPSPPTSLGDVRNAIDLLTYIIGVNEALHPTQAQSVSARTASDQIQRNNSLRRKGILITEDDFIADFRHRYDASQNVDHLYLRGVYSDVKRHRLVWGGDFGQLQNKPESTNHVEMACTEASSDSPDKKLELSFMVRTTGQICHLVFETERAQLKWKRTLLEAEKIESHHWWNNMSETERAGESRSLTSLRRHVRAVNAEEHMQGLTSQELVGLLQWHCQSV